MEIINMQATETKSERFVRIAEARTNKIIGMIQLLGNCANKSTYEYTKEEVKLIFSAIETELRAARAKFDAGENESGKKSFSLRK